MHAATESIAMPTTENVVRPKALVRPSGFPLDAPMDPQARSLGELISSKQIRMAGKLARERGTDCNYIALMLFDCDIAELSRPAAEVLIEYLENLAGGSFFPQQLRLTG